MGFIFFISREHIKSRGSSMLRPSQPKTAFYRTASVTSCFWKNISLEHHQQGHCIEPHLAIPQLLEPHTPATADLPTGPSNKGTEGWIPTVTTWQNREFKSQELFLQGITAPKHSFSPAAPQDTVLFPAEQHFQPPEGSSFSLKLKLLFL